MSRTIQYFHVYIRLDFPIAYGNASVICQSECACLHKTVNLVVFFVKINDNTYANWKAHTIFRVVPITKRGNCPRCMASSTNDSLEYVNSRNSYCLSTMSSMSVYWDELYIRSVLFCFIQKVRDMWT